MFKDLIRIRTLAVVAGFSSGLWAGSVQAGYIYADIADISGAFDFSASAQVNDNGTVVFRTIDGGTRTIFTGNGGALTTVAQSGGAGQPVLVGFPTIANDGSVVYSTIETNGDRRLIRNNGGTDTVIFSLNSEAAFASAIRGNSVSNNGGNVAFSTSLTAGGTGIFTGDGTPGGPFTPVATTADGFSGFGNQVSVNNSGTAAFLAGPSVGGATVSGDGSGPVTTIADSSTNAPSGQQFAFFGDAPQINNNGDVAFVALFAGFADGGFFVGDGGVLTEVLLFSDLPKDLASVSNPDIGDDGTVAFELGFTDGTEGIFTGPDLALDKVLATGDALFGSTVETVDFFRGLNNNGSIAIDVVLTDGSRHVVRADLVDAVAVSEPSLVWLGALGLIGLVVVRRRYKE